MGTLAWSAQADVSSWLGFVERDLADKLRRLRASDPKILHPATS